MPLIVHGDPRSTCTQRVLVALVEKGVEYEVRTIDWAAKEHKQAAFLAKQPFGKVPVLEDDGFFVYESRAMAKYIAKKYAGQGTKLIPDEADVKGYGLFEQACSVEQNYFNGPAEGLAVEAVFKKMKGLGEPDDEILKKLAAELDATLAVYDVILAKTAYLAADSVTLADLYHLPYGKIAKSIGYADLFAKYPNVNRWFDALEARESWKKVTGGK